MKNPIVKLDSVSFEYEKSRPVLEDLSIDFNGGQVTGILGENGAGKTTLFDIVSGDLGVTKGTLSLAMAREQVSYLQQVINLPPALKVREVLEMIACFQRLSSTDADVLIRRYWSDAMIERYNKIKDRRTGVCSYGEKRSMVVCATLAFGHDKQLFILDEPTAGVDVQHRHLIWRLIKDMQSEDRAFVVSSHLIDEIGKNTDSFFLLNDHSARLFTSTEQFITEYGGTSSEEAFVNATVSALQGNRA